MADISFDDFKKLDIRTAEIKEVHDIEGADRLYKLVIDMGEKRQLVAGIKGHYDKESLVGKKIAVLANLAPKNIKGVASHGMLLAAVTEGKEKLVILTTDGDIPNGTKIS